MNQTELEKLVKVPESNGNGYRSSLSVEAAEVLDYIRQTRPELFEHVLAEAKRQEEKQNPQVTTALAKITTEVDFSDISKCLENTIAIEDQGKFSIYKGKLYQLNWKFKEEQVLGEAKLVKTVIITVKKNKWELFPPRITEIEVQKEKEVWIVDTYPLESRSEIILGGEICFDYRDRLTQQAQRKNKLLSSSLLKAVFDPIDQKLLGIYNTYKQ